MKTPTHDSMEQRFDEKKICFLTDHEIVWDGNYYVCQKCWTEFVPKSLISSQNELLALIKEHDAGLSKAVESLRGTVFGNDVVVRSEVLALFSPEKE